LWKAATLVCCRRPGRADFDVTGLHIGRIALAKAIDLVIEAMTSELRSGGEVDDGH